MNLLNKYENKKKINLDEIINKSAVALVFEEDKTGNLKKYSFAKANPDGSLTVLHSGKILTGYQTLCHSERTYAGAGQGCVASHITIDKMIGSYSTEAKELVYFKIRRNPTTAEHKEINKKPNLTLGGVFVDEKNIFNSEKSTVTVQELLDFENHMNKILFNNNGKNYPVEYEDIVSACREQQNELIKKSNRPLGSEEIMII